MDLDRKRLGQHWLTDEQALNYIVDSANLSPNDTVLEVGPGTGALTKKLLEGGVKIIAVEKDAALAKNLPTSPNLEVISGDILKFDLTQLSAGYKVVANIPYYLTSNLLRILTESANPPAAMTLLLQKEVAERVCATPGQMSILAVSAQLDYESELGRVVPADLFVPAPKVDSQLVVLSRRQTPLFSNLDRQKYFQVVKAGFSARRKKLRSSLAGGLRISKERAEELLKRAGISADRRAQELSLDDWYKIYLAYPARNT